MKRCSNCGKKISEYSLSCPYCSKSNSSDISEIFTALNSGKKKIIPVILLLIIISLIAVFVFHEGNTSNLSFFESRRLINSAQDILERDLNTAVQITTLYYNEEKQGYLVGFTADNINDVAAIHLDSDIIEYQSEFDYYSSKAEWLRNESPINETALHECNEKILSCTDLIGWKFTIQVDGATEENGWEMIK